MYRVFFAFLIIGVCFVLGTLVTRGMDRYRKAHHKTGWTKGKQILLSTGSGLSFLAVYLIIYFSLYYHAFGETAEYLVSSRDVEVKKRGNDYFFDGPGTDTALVFYPGGKVQTESYAPLLHKLSEAGIDTFLLDMPLHLAIFGKDRADGVLQNYSYENWYMSGHSLGGVVAGQFASENRDRLNGMILLAAYPTEALPEELAFLSIYGSEDQCLEEDIYEETKKNWPSNGKEYVIDGGNHAMFGNYGPQSGDGEGRITAEEQQRLTIDRILEFVENDAG